MAIDQTGWSEYKKKLQKVLVENELTGNASKAYKISNAQRAKSGYSFGYNQMDLAANPQACTYLEDIMDNAKNSAGEPIVADEEKTDIKARWGKRVTEDGRLTPAQIELLTKALSSEYGKGKVDSCFGDELDKTIRHINSIIESVPDAQDKTFLDTDLAKLFLADYHNQYHLSKNGKMHDYLKGNSVEIAGGTVKKDGAFDWADLMNFYAKTDYNLKNGEISGKRRALNVVKFSGSGEADRLNKIVEDAFSGRKTVGAGLTLSIPIDIGGGVTPSGKLAGDLYKHTEKDHGGGYFPLGANTVWHGGIHLRGAKKTKVLAFMDGDIIAAKLSEGKDQAYGKYGSHNFILMKHEVSGAALNKQFENNPKFKIDEVKTVYSLYMHLHNEILDPSANAALQDFVWIRKKDGYKVAKDINLRSEMKVEPASVIAVLSSGTQLDVIDDGKKVAGGYEWLKVKVVSGPHKDKAGYVAVSGKVAENLEKLKGEIDQELLGKLKGPDVVPLKVPVKAGDVLWLCGEYGSTPVPLLHWEIFSEENLFPSFTSVEDGDEDCNMDTAKIFKMVDQDDSWFDDKTNLSDKEVIRFYKNDKDAELLRKYSCKFISEWALNLDVAIPKMKGRFFTLGLQERLEPYLWWQKAVAKGVTVPASSHVWHYNPITFVAMLAGVTPVADVASSPEEKKDAATGTGYGGFVLKKGDNDSKKIWGGAKQSSEGKWVEELQTDLKRLGYWISDPVNQTAKGIGIDGDFGTNLEFAVKTFQFEGFVIDATGNIDAAKKDKVTGVVDAETEKKIKDKVKNIGAKKWDRPGHNAKKSWKISGVNQPQKDYGTFFQLPPSTGYYRANPSVGVKKDYTYSKETGLTCKQFEVIPGEDCLWMMADCYGTKGQIDMLKNVGDDWIGKVVGGRNVPAIQIGDISGFSGGPFDPHRSHRDGTGTDLQGVVTSVRDFREEWHRDCALELAKLLKAKGAKRILVNCHYVIKNCSIAQMLIGHHHHFHVDGPDAPVPAANGYTTCNQCGIFSTCTKKIKKVRKNATSPIEDYSNTAAQGSSNGLYAEGDSRTRGTVKLSQVVED